MVIELLKFQISPELQEKYILMDAEIWTAALAKYPGFISKEVWINPNDSKEVVLVIRWETREHWKAIPQSDLEAIATQFDTALAKSYPIVEFAEYQVRKFPHS